jgi:DNA-binding FrmR family transcriptional regulator
MGVAHSYETDRDELIARLRRIEGQVRGIQRMLAADAYCVDVLTQVSAVVSGMEKVGLRLLKDHMRGCVAEALASKDRGDEKIDEVVRVVERFLA